MGCTMCWRTTGTWWSVRRPIRRSLPRKPSGAGGRASAVTATGMPDAGELLVLADSGGSNGCRPRLWKWCLQHLLADRYGLDVTVCHYPRGASKWNPVEHRLFGPISVNWAGVPLRTPAVMLGFIRGTSTDTGLAVTAEWWERQYRKGVKVSKAEMAELNIEYHDTCPRWNYTIRPRINYQ